MLHGIDTSNWQQDYNPNETGVDFVICKATEGVGFVDAYCDTIAQRAIGAGMLFGFYHFAGTGDAIAEADFFLDNCAGYFGIGIPVLDWEGDQDVDWVNAFVERVHEREQVWPVIYGNPWRFAQGPVNENCARWVASYPNVGSPTFEQAEAWECPECDGFIAMWQFCSDGEVPGIFGNVDCDVFYGSRDAWAAYVSGERENTPQTAPEDASGSVSVLENEEYVVEVRKK